VAREFYHPTRRQVEQQRQRHGKAFQAWELEDDQDLQNEADKGTDLLELAALFTRSPRAIRMRLELLGLIDRWQQARNAAPVTADPENEIAKDPLAYAKKALKAPRTHEPKRGG